MNTSFRKNWPIAVALLFGFCFASLVEAQLPNADPFNNRVASREARLAYIASQRAKASVPVNYSFPVRADAATAYSAAAYSPQYQYSLRPNYAAAGSPTSAYRPADYRPADYRPALNTYGYTQGSAYHTDGRPCPLAARPPATRPPVAARPPLTTQRPPVDPYWGSSAYANSSYARPYSAAYTAGAPYGYATPASYYGNAAASRVGSNYYVGSSAAGPPKVYPKDEPVRNVFRYLFP